MGSGDRENCKDVLRTAGKRGGGNLLCLIWKGVPKRNCCSQNHMGPEDYGKRGVNEKKRHNTTSESWVIVVALESLCWIRLVTEGEGLGWE